MISSIRNSVLTRFFWGMMGLYLLNISVDTADPYPEHIPEDLSFNDQESIVEIIIEKVLGYENAIAEYDDHDTEDHKKKSNVKTDLSVCLITSYKSIPLFFKERKQRFLDYEACLASGFVEIDSPPPNI